MQFNELRQIQFNLKYETKIINLLDELAYCFEKQYSILVDLSSYFIHEIFEENTITSPQQKVEELYTNLKKYAAQAYDLIEELKKTIDFSIPFKNENNVSEKIQDIVDEATTAKHKYERLEKYLPDGLIRLKDALNGNLSSLTDYIDTYNKKFSGSLITVSQARQNFFKKYNEAADQLMEDIRRINKARGLDIEI